jgi:cytidine deaminase
MNRSLEAAPLISPELYNPQRFVHPETGKVVQLEQDLRERAIQTLILAREAVSVPTQSGYYVRTAVSTAEGLFGYGGNIESWAGKAEQHGETAAICTAYQLNGEFIKGRIDVMANYVPQLDGYACSCGDCRDVIREHCHIAKGYIFDGNPDKGFIYTLPMKEMYNDIFQGGTMELVPEGLFEEARRALLKAQDGLVHPHRRRFIYGAAAQNARGDIFPGIHIAQAGYHPIHPFQSIESKIYGFADSTAEYTITDVVVVCGEDIPYIQYAGRQVLDDHRSRQAQALDAIADDIRIKIVKLDQSGDIVAVQQTTAREWLPYPFSLADFGMDHVIQEDFEKIIQY